MVPKFKKYPLLLPIAWLYGIGVRWRNFLFDRGWLRSVSFPIPIISVGNITVGGTGKTPHTEYLIQLISDLGLKVAVLSRGYKRKTKGFQLYSPDSTARSIGDEPYQIAQKFDNIRVAVNADRVIGVQTILDSTDTEVVVLDDAFQHRYIQPGLQILLIDSLRPIHEDWLLPAGRLREPKEGIRRADIVVITKCHKEEKYSVEEWRKVLALEPRQQLYFSTMQYGALYFPFNNRPTLSLVDLQAFNVLAVTAIANPASFIDTLRTHCQQVDALTYTDHHDFTEEDITDIVKRMRALPSPRLLITTEKDAARLRLHKEALQSIETDVAVLPISITFLHHEQALFNQNIIDYVTKNSRNSELLTQ